MFRQIRSLNPRQLVALGLIVAGLFVGILLIVLWQVGLFDSAPPPVELESAVESLQQDRAEQEGDSTEQAQLQAEQPQPQSSADESQAAGEEQPRQASTSDAYGQQDQESQPAQDADEQPAGSYDYGEQQAQPQQAADQPQPQQSEEEAQESVMTAESPALEDLAGTWVLSSQGASFVGYRIGEELANIGTATAVGRTSDVVVTLEFDGAVITSVVIEADLRTLKSDQSFRDGALRTRGIETDTYPFATFVLTEPIPIDALPIGEESLNRIVQGTLDLHGVTNPVSVALEGQYVDGLVVVVGSTDIALADYDIDPPTGFRVLSIDDVGIMEFQLVLERGP